MSALRQELPLSFKDALRLAGSLLSRSADLVKKGVITTEAEQIVQAAYRNATGRFLSRVDLYSRGDDRFPEAAGEKVIIFASARSEGKLLQHLVGYQVFLDHEYLVGPDVLVPRPETEALVLHAIRELGAQFGGAPRSGLEIGIGSGVIAVELLAKFASLRMIATELSPEAQSRAEENASRIVGEGARGVARLKILPAKDPKEVWEPFERDGVAPAQFLISNPPYLASAGETDAEVAAHEPHSALFAPKGDPLFFYRGIARGVDRFVEPGGILFLEVPHERAEKVAELFGEKMRPELVADLSGRNRILVARA